MKLQIHHYTCTNKRSSDYAEHFRWYPYEQETDNSRFHSQCDARHYPDIRSSTKSTSPHVRWRQRLDYRGTLLEPGSENPVCILEHAILQTDNDELTALESSLDQPTNILRMRQIERGIDFVEDVHRRWLELEERHDQGEGDERSGRILSARRKRD